MSSSEATAVLTAPGAPFEIVEEEVRGVPTRVWRHAPRTMTELLHASRAHGDATFLVYEDERLSFEEHFRAAAALATALRERYGVEKGDRVAIAMRNYPEWVVAFWATTASGAIAVPLNAWWTGEELEYGLADSGAVVLVADEQRVAAVASHLPTLDLRGVIVARARGAVGAGSDRYEDVVGSPGPDVALPPVELDTDDDATIFYTSGTTGEPKGAVGTHRNICSNLMTVAFGAARGALRAGLEPGTPPVVQPASLLSVPLFHVTGCHATLVPNAVTGGKLVMMYKWDPERALELIERERIQRFGGVPAMVMQVLESPELGRRDTSSVVAIGYGGAPAPPELVRRIKEAFPAVQPGNGYGLTETSSIVTSNSGEDYVRKPDSIGTPTPVCELQVVDPEGAEVPPGEVGELWVKGPNVVRGYWHKPEATAEAITDGWFHTGDVVFVDDEGFVHIVDRAKDVVIRGGENVYCVEVEAVLHEHRAVMEAAVVGLPHRVLGEEVGAVVYLKPGAAASEDELRAHVASRLAGFKVPARVDVRPVPLPRSPQGKIQKRELRDEMAVANS